MIFRRQRLALVLLGDRLVAASVDGAKVEMFLVDSEQPATTLRAELDQRRLAVRTVALGLPRGAVTVKPIELPDVGGELRDMVQFELERHVPFPTDDASFDFLELPAEADGAGAASAARRVLIVVADRRVVDGALRLAEDAHLRPISLTVAAHDLQALVPSRIRGHVVWIHRVAETMALLFVADGQIVLSRSVATGDDEVIAAEIERSLAVTRWRTVDAIWVSGDDEAPDAGAATPRALLGMAVTPPPYTARARALLAQVGGAPVGAAQLALAVAVGARRAPPLQLLPLRLRPRRLTRPQLMAVGAVAAAVVLGVTALVIPGYRENRRLSTINRRIAALDGEVRTVEQTLQELERKRRLLATIQSLDSTAVRPLPVLRELTELLPNDAWLTTVSLDPKGMELTGQAAAASALIPLLENSPRLERAEFASPVTRGRDKEQFRIRASWEMPAVAQPPKPPASREAAQRPRGPSGPSGDPAAPMPRRPPDAPAFPGGGPR
jgi:Tfp pilus assembly protein PilN